MSGVKVRPGDECDNCGEALDQESEDLQACFWCDAPLVPAARPSFPSPSTEKESNE